jgi:hypothetical protein
MVNVLTVNRAGSEFLFHLRASGVALGAILYLFGRALIRCVLVVIVPWLRHLVDSVAFLLVLLISCAVVFFTFYQFFSRPSSGPLAQTQTPPTVVSSASSQTSDHALQRASSAPASRYAMAYVPPVFILPVTPTPPTPAASTTPATPEPTRRPPATSARPAPATPTPVAVHPPCRLHVPKGFGIGWRIKHGRRTSCYLARR